jgi:para-nitrobenzyl esterase
VVRIEQGEIEGAERGGMHSFLGLPYAAPPLGELRWAPPAPAPKWQGVHDATRFGPACAQVVGAAFDLRVTEQREDCLYLNVWTATLDPRAHQPVMVWIHGGGNLAGAGSEDAFDGAQLATHGVTVVTFNYRLSAFGYLNHPDTGANFAVLDHVAALSWVAANIEAFGGDPNTVTVFGESAGAVAVRTLLSTPAARGLFHRAIIQSAGFEKYAAVPAPSNDRSATASATLLDRLGGSIERARSAPTHEVLRVSHELSGIFPVPGQVHTPANLVWMPVANDRIVASDGFPGWPDDVPVMLGCLENEARYFLRSRDVDRGMVEQMARALAGSRSADVLTLLSDQKSECYEAMDRLFTAAIWLEPALATVKRFDSLNKRTYYYHFNRVSPGARRTGDLAKHSAEIRYVFGNLWPADDYDDVDVEVSRAMQAAWVCFARTGAPPDDWPRYMTIDPSMTLIEDTVSDVPFGISELTSMIHSVRGDQR